MSVHEIKLDSLNQTIIIDCFVSVDKFEFHGKTVDNKVDNTDVCLAKIWSQLGTDFALQYCCC